MLRDWPWISESSPKPDLGEQLGRIDRLGDVVLGPWRMPPHPVGLRLLLVQMMMGISAYSGCD